MSTPCQDIFGKNMLFNLASVADWRVATTAKQRQVDIDNVRGKSRRVTHEYVIGNQVYVEMTEIYRKIDYKKQRLYKITLVFTNGTVQVKRDR